MGEKFEKVEGETLEEYQMRLSVLKLVDGMDIDWTEIRDLLVEAGMESKHPDNIRKEGYAFVKANKILEKKLAEMEDEYYYKLKRMKEKVDEEIEDKRAKELQNKINQLQKEKQKLKDERNFINAERRTVARLEHLVECTKEAILKLNDLKPLIQEDIINVGNEDRDGIVLLSDMHLGAYAENMLDQYNPEISKEKLNYYIDRVCGQIVKDGIKNTYFLVAGDICSGIIHNTTRFSNRLNISEQVAFASELLAEAINKISEYSNVQVGIIAGNHDRIVIDKTEHLESENFVEFIRAMVGLRLKDNKRVTMLEPQDCTLLSLNIRGYKIAVVHGNLDKKRNISRLVEMQKEVYDYILQGHWHKFDIEQYNHTTVVTNGAFGGEEYGKNARLYNKPEQLYMEITDEGIDTIIPINLDNYKK